MQIGLGFWASKTLLTAVHMGLFTYLGAGPKPAGDIQSELGLHDRSLFDFLDTLVALGFLQREGIKTTAVYSNAEDTALFLDKNKPTYLGGMLEMANKRLYPFWGNLEDGLKTGQPQNEVRQNGQSMFEKLYSDPDRLREFVSAMGGIQMGNFIAFAQNFDFSNYKTLCDVGGAGGYLSAQVALHNPHMRCVSLDLPQVTPIATANLEKMGVADRVLAQTGNFFEDDLPKADVITMGNILHDWGMKEKMVLLKKAYDALPAGGALVVIEALIDDERRQNAFGLMMSLNMLIETAEGFDFSVADFSEWAREAGFRDIRMMPLTGPSSAAIAVK